eukprot:scaffold2665_cov114-Skeletonema_menzelii.AAC.1
MHPFYMANPCVCVMSGGKGGAYLPLSNPDHAALKEASGVEQINSRQLTNSWPARQLPPFNPLLNPTQYHN